MSNYVGGFLLFGFFGLVVVALCWIVYSRHRCFACHGFVGAKQAPPVFEYTATVSYHDKCLHDVLNNPERYGHSVTDMAIDIQGRVAHWNKADKERMARAEQARAALKDANG